jgi:hypothetical protein
VKTIRCQGKSFITTDDVARAIVNFSKAAQRRGRVVKIDVPTVANDGSDVVSLILSPGEPVEVLDSAHETVELDTAPLIRSLSARALAWRPAAAAPDDGL